MRKDARLVDGWECVEEPGPLGLRERHPHPGHEGRVEDDGPDLVAGGQVDRGHSADALTVKDYVLWKKKGGEL